MHGENITVECNHNYELEGNVTQITCNNGTFDRMPKCEPARCKTLPAPPKNGMVVVSFYSHFCYLNSFGPNINSQYFWKWTNANPMKNFGQAATASKL